TAAGTVTLGEADVLTAGTAGVTAAEGAAFAGAVATFTDSNTANVAGDFIATIDWGDGTATAGTVSGGNGTFTISGTHTYAEEGAFSVKATLTEDAPGTATATANGTATVSDPKVFVNPSPLDLQAGVDLGALILGTFSDPGGAEDVTHYRVDVAWGD